MCSQHDRPTRLAGPGAPTGPGGTLARTRPVTPLRYHHQAMPSDRRVNIYYPRATAEVFDRLDLAPAENRSYLLSWAVVVRSEVGHQLPPPREAARAILAAESASSAA